MDKIQQNYYEMQVINSHLEQIEKDLDKIEEQILEVNVILQSLEDIKNTEEGNETLMPLSNGIFVKAKISKSDKLIVNVGQNVLVEKSIDETKEIILKQLTELEQYKDLLNNEMNKLSEKALLIEKESDQIAGEKNV